MATANLTHCGGAAVEGSTITTAVSGISAQSRNRGGSGGASSPWTRMDRVPGGGDSELTVLSPTASSVSVAAATGFIAPPTSSSTTVEVQITHESSTDHSPTAKASEAIAISAAPSTSYWPDDDTAEDLPESSEGGNYHAAKRPVWNKPNGAAEVGSVMGAVSWPDLSESTRASPKSSPDLQKYPFDAPVSNLQPTGMASLSPHKLGVSNNANPTNHTPFNQQRSMKRGGGGNQSNSIIAGGSFSQLQSPKNSGTEVTPNNSGRHGKPAAESPPRDNTRDGGQRGGFGSQSHWGNEHQHQRSSFRRGSGNQHPHGDGSHHHGYGGRRGEQGHGNQDWSSNRNFGGRDNHMQQQRIGSRPFIRGPPPPPPTTFIPPPPLTIRPFGTPMVYSDVPPPVFYIPGLHPETIRAVSFVPPMPPFFYTLPDPQLHAKIINQIEYYFSNENLIKDTFLRQNMDEQGWVPVKLIASFKKVMQLTDNIYLILDAIRMSSVVEVEGEKMRRRNDWIRWIMHSAEYSNVSSPQPVHKSSQDILSANFLNITLDENTPKHSYTDTYLSPSSSGEWSSHSQQSTGDKAAQMAVQSGLPALAANTSK